MKTKRKQGGESTSNLVCSALTGNNAELFAKIASLYFKEGDRIADTTFGKGVFWRDIDTTAFEFFPSDIKTGVDARSLPYETESFDVCVFDPPYMEGLLRDTVEQMAGNGNFSPFRERYSDAKPHHNSNCKYHDRVLNLYLQSSVEALRILKEKGLFVVKCQDEVSAGRQKLTHVELIYALEGMGFYCRDIFVLLRKNKPAASRVKSQKHARKSHSYFLVFEKHIKTRNPYKNCVIRDFYPTFS